MRRNILPQCSMGMKAGTCCLGIMLQVYWTQWRGAASWLSPRGQNNRAAVQMEQERAQPANLSDWQSRSGYPAPSDLLTAHIQWRSRASGNEVGILSML